jgi:hypothetical protein
MINTFFTIACLGTPFLSTSASAHRSFDRLCTYAAQSVKLCQNFATISSFYRPSISSRIAVKFDLYIAASDQEEPWLQASLLPSLRLLNVCYTTRTNTHSVDQLEILSNQCRCRQSRLIYFLITSRDRLSDLTTELAFLIGERRYCIIVYLEPVLDLSVNTIQSISERSDIERSRKYLEDLAEREDIVLCRSREQSCHFVEEFFRQA